VVAAMKCVACTAAACPNKVTSPLCDYHAPRMCSRVHVDDNEVRELHALLNAVLRGEDILTDRKWMRRCKSALGDFGP
jgi:hypothetical protein